MLNQQLQQAPALVLLQLFKTCFNNLNIHTITGQNHSVTMSSFIKISLISSSSMMIRYLWVVKTINIYGDSWQSGNCQWENVCRHNLLLVNQVRGVRTQWRQMFSLPHKLLRSHLKLIKTVRQWTSHHNVPVALHERVTAAGTANRQLADLLTLADNLEADSCYRHRWAVIEWELHSSLKHQVVFTVLFFVATIKKLSRTKWCCD